MHSFRQTLEKAERELSCCTYVAAVRPLAPHVVGPAVAALAAGVVHVAAGHGVVVALHEDSNLGRAV